MIQFQKELEEESNSSDEEENVEEEKKNEEEQSLISSEKGAAGRSFKLKRIKEKVKSSHKEADPIKLGALKQLKKIITLRLRNFNYRILSNSLYRFFSKHVMINLYFLNILYDFFFFTE